MGLQYFSPQLALTESISIIPPIDSLQRLSRGCAVTVMQLNKALLCALCALGMSAHTHTFTPFLCPSFCQMLPGLSSCWRSCRSQVTCLVTSSSLWRRSFRVSSAQPSERWVTVNEGNWRSANISMTHVFSFFFALWDYLFIWIFYDDLSRASTCCCCCCSSLPIIHWTHSVVVAILPV